MNINESFALRPLAVTSKENYNVSNCSSSADIFRSLYQWIYTISINHVQSVQKIRPEFISEELSSLKEHLYTVEDTSTGKKINQQVIIDNVKKLLQSVFQGSLKMSKRMNEEIKQLQKDKQVRKSFEKDNYEEKYRSLSKHLIQISEAMNLLEDTNKQLLKRSEELEKDNEQLNKQYNKLQEESKVKDGALEKAQAVIQQLYQDSIRPHSLCSMNSIGTITEDNRNKELLNSNQRKDLEIVQLKKELADKEREYKERLRVVSLQMEKSNTRKNYLENPLVPLLIGELEKVASKEYGVKEEYCNEIISKLNTCKDCISDLLEHIPQVESNEEHIVLELVNLLNQYNSQIKDLNDLLRINKELQLKLEAENKSLRESSRQREEEVKIFTATRQELDKCQLELNSIKEVMIHFNITSSKELHRTLQSLIEERKRLGNEIQKYKEACKNDGRSIELMKEILNDKDCEIIKLKDEHNKLYEQLETNKIELREVLNQLNIQVEKLNKIEKYNKNLQSELKCKDNKIRSYQNTVDQLQVENKDIKKCLIKLQNDEVEVKELKRALETSRKSYNELLKNIQSHKLSADNLISTVQTNKDPEDIKTLRMLLLEKDNYIAQLEQHNNELLHEYEFTLHKQVDSEFPISHTPCNDCGSLTRQLKEMQEEYKHKLSRNNKEFDAILTHIVNLIEGKSNTKEISRRISKVLNHNERLRTCLDNLRIAINRMQDYQYQYRSFLSFVINIITQKQVKQQLEIQEMQRIAVSALQEHFRLHN